ncbi:hypothetical protein MP638_000016 [Amoeboaphelidium occidentale]|nr:hypothetical protein MP638_000016 [Amoeboaphelidium occidentale]
MIVGASFLSAAVSDNRSELVNKYGVVVNDWTKNNRAKFEKAGPFEVNGIVVTASTDQPKLTDYKADELPKYSALQYQTSLSAPFSDGLFRVKLSNDTQSFGNDYNGLLQTTNKTYSKFTWDCAEPGDADICTTSTWTSSRTRRTTVRCKDMCTERCASAQGTWDPVANICTVKFYLTSVCFVVKNSNGFWNYNSGRFATAGCSSRSRNSEISIEGFYPGSYSKSPTTSIPVTIRSADDPFYYADVLTSGSLSFGLTAGDNARYGIIFMILGSLLIGSLFLCCFGTYKIVSVVVNGGTRPAYAPAYMFGHNSKFYDQNGAAPYPASSQQMNGYPNSPQGPPYQPAGNPQGPYPNAATAPYPSQLHGQYIPPQQPSYSGQPQPAYNAPQPQPQPQFYQAPVDYPPQGMPVPNQPVQYPPRGMPSASQPPQYSGNGYYPDQKY